MSGNAPRRKSVRFHVEFVTPCFLGGADGKSAEWRSASIRGQLRWWLRAVAPGDLRQVRSLEERIFGSTSQASNVIILASDSPTPSSGGVPCKWGPNKTAEQLAAGWNENTAETVKRLKLEQSPTSNPVHYLGYGPILWISGKKEVQITRQYIEPVAKSSTFFDLRWGRLDEQSERLLLSATAAWLLLGGIGARSRRGFGSLCIKNVEPALGVDFDFAPDSREKLKGQIQTLLKLRSSDPPLWSRFSTNTRVCLASEVSTWEDAMSQVGSWMIAFRRRYGSEALDKRRVPEQKGPGLDYEWAAKNGKSRRAGFPDRVGFGLPLPFGKDAESIAWGDADHDNRRASPLLIHITKTGEHKYVPVLTHLPAPLIPENEELFFRDAKRDGQKQRGKQPEFQPVLHEIVKTFLDDLARKKLVETIQ